MHPVLGGEVVEREQFVEIVGDLRDSLAELGPVSQLERRDAAAGVVAVLGVPDLGQGPFRARGGPTSAAPTTRCRFCEAEKN